LSKNKNFKSCLKDLLILALSISFFLHEILNEILINNIKNIKNYNVIGEASGGQS